MLDKRFNLDNEKEMQKLWEEKEAYKFKGVDERPIYSVDTPPPTVSGKLHVGHIFSFTQSEMLVRYHRLKGENVYYPFGFDDNGLPTERLVEREEGIFAKDLPRSEFIEKCTSTKDKYIKEFQDLFKRLGISADWDLGYDTINELSRKVSQRSFIDLVKKGKAYRKEMPVLWCPCCQTSIAQAELENKDVKSYFNYINFSVENKNLEIATTRPEFLGGCVAIFVNPNDERYKDIIGKTCILPIMNKEIPIIADDFVEKDFGTGCVKITPAHDMNDYQAGIRNNLEIVEVFDDSSIMLDLVPEYKGMKAIEARKLIVEELEKIGALVKTEDYTHNVGKCYRCHSTIEPRISEQWFVKMKDLAKVAADSVRNDEVKFVPKRYEKMYFNWLDNIQDWCISRQLWWGHRIPAYYCKDCNHINVSREKVTKCEKCSSTNVVQDEDTLDTWFSSALWPFSTLGWPEETEDYKYFYPTNVLVTGYDIIFFWVIRMIFSGYEHMGRKPFGKVLFHGLVRDDQGRKMSKSLGNGIDPLEVIDKYGADALRYTLITGNAPGNDMRFYWSRVEASRNFANKVWNASRFIMMNDPDNKIKATDERPANLTDADKWILSKMNGLIKEVTDNMEKYELGIAVAKLNDFIWEEFCDWYIEMVKPRLYNDADETKTAAIWTLKTVLIDALKLLHPYMPFITEEIFCNIQDEEESIMISSWPVYDETNNFAAEEKAIETIKEAVRNIRNLRADMNVAPSRKALVYVVTASEDVKNIFNNSLGFFGTLAYASEVKVQADKAGIPEDAVSTVIPDAVIYIPFAELVDIDKEIERLKKEEGRLQGEIKRCNGMLNNERFTSKAPQAKIDEEKAKLVKYTQMLEQVTERLATLSK